MRTPVMADAIKILLTKDIHTKSSPVIISQESFFSGVILMNT